MKYFFLIVGTFFFFQNSFTQIEPLWLRYPAISPDGQEIVFSYKGDLYKVNAGGGTAYPLTLHEGRDFMPVWSPDGQSIAFASERYGNYDVFLISSEGGPAKRLTHHSASDYPSDFTPDGQQVLFSSARLDDHRNQQFPRSVLSELYQVSIQGGTPNMALTLPAERAQISSDGQKLIYHDRKGYEDAFRKHHESSVTRDIWLHDLSERSFRKLTNFKGEDRNPCYAPGEDAIYFLSELEGDFNVFKLNLEPGSTPEPLTSFTKHPVRQLTASNNGLMAFSWHGELYTLREGEEPQKIKISIFSGDRYNPETTKKISKASEYHLSPNGKEIAFVHRGEVFVSSVSKGTTKRITNTPEQERSVSFSPDGRSILYAGERHGSWNIYQTSLTREEEKYFFQSTILEEQALVASDKTEFQPAYSPDGKEVAYLEERTALKVYNIASGETRLVLPGDKNYSYSDGDQFYEWSPDSKWFLVEFNQPNQWIGEVGLVSASGKEEVINLSQSGYRDYRPKWMMKGQMMLWFSDRHGMRNHASWGSEGDAYGMFFTQEAYDTFRLTEEEYELMKEEEKDKKDETETETKTKTENESETENENEEIQDIEIQLEDIENRKVRLTIHSSRMGDAILSRDGEKLYYLARFEKGYDLWQTELRSRDTKILTKLKASSAGSLQLDKEGKHLFLLASGKVHKIDLSDGKKESIATSSEMNLREEEERAYLYEHIWRQVEKKFYRKDLHEVDWEFYKEEYARFLPHINNNYDFAEMLSELLGELNASHTGARFRARSKTGDQTASLGIYFDYEYEGPGIKIAEIMDNGPLDNSSSKAMAGMIIEAIDGKDIIESVNYFALLNRKKGEKTLLTLRDTKADSTLEEVVEPISLGKEYNLRYKRWVENCRQIVEEASGGDIGYVHVKGMNDPSFRVVYEEALGKNAQKKALVVDTRFNGGGWLHDDLATFLNGKQYIRFYPRGQELGAEPQFKWQRPSIVVMSESNYSDAHMFPFTYRELGVGQLVGTPVPGTGTAVWWERLQNGMVFGIPQVGMLTNDDEYLENNQLEPDILVYNSPEKVTIGKDEQLEAAVDALKELLKVE